MQSICTYDAFEEGSKECTTSNIILLRQIPFVHARLQRIFLFFSLINFYNSLLLNFSVISSLGHQNAYTKNTCKKTHKQVNKWLKWTNQLLIHLQNNKISTATYLLNLIVKFNIFSKIVRSQQQVKGCEKLNL